MVHSYTHNSIDDAGNVLRYANKKGLLVQNKHGVYYMAPQPEGAPQLDLTGVSNIRASEHFVFEFVGNGEMSFDTQKYKGNEITVNSSGEFVCEELELKASSLAALKKKIDASVGDQAALHPIKVLRMSRLYSRFGYEVLTVTRLAKNPTWRTEREVWVKDSSGNRKKVYITNLLPFNIAAFDIIAQRLKEQTEERNALETKHNEEIKTMRKDLGMEWFTLETLQAACANAAGDSEE